MNAHPAFNFDAEPEAPTPNLPIPRETLESMERNRAKALELMTAAFDQLEEGRRLAALAAGSTSGELSFGEEVRQTLAPSYHHKTGFEPARAAFLEAVTYQLDRAMWGHIVRATDLERLMDHKARKEMREQLGGKPPPATADNVRATLLQFAGEADEIFKRGIAIAFSQLDRRFKSHDGFKIGGRVILSSMFSTDWPGLSSYGHRDETLRDIERTFCILDGKPHPEYGAGIMGDLTQRGLGLSFEVEGDYFKVVRYKNGNAHLWFTRKDLLLRVNRLLADYYGEAIGEGSEVADTSAMGPGYHLTPARNFGLFESPQAVVDAVFERLGYVEAGARVLEPSAGRGRLADEAKKRGYDVQCVEIQHGLCAELRLKGHRVREGNFLEITPDQLGLFDVIVMNPPFDQGRDCDHVRHALQFLKPGGKLVSVMAAGVEFRETSRAKAFRALIDKQDRMDRFEHWGPYHDLPAGSFAESGTNVNTITLAVRKPK